VKLAQILAAWVLFVVALCVALRARYAWETLRDGEVVASVWNKGVLVERAVVARDGTTPALERARRAGGSLVHERVTARGRVVVGWRELFAVSFVAARDGVRATLGDHVAYVTPDDLLSRQLYDKGVRIDPLALVLGVDYRAVEALLAERLGAPQEDLLDRATIERVRMERVENARPSITAASLSKDDAARAIRAAGTYLARAVDDKGRFRYVVDAPSNRVQPGYNWPRHAGGTYFLAQAAAFTGDPAIRAACLRAAEVLRKDALQRCGDDLCIGEGASVDLGSAALGAMALIEIVRTGIDDSFRPQALGLVRFLRAQQRPDGEFMHEYHRYANRRVDVQLPYYSGEAALALTRAYAITRDPGDRDAASRALAHLVGPAWSFFGDRYYFGEEHWTCQTMGELWPAAPDKKALDFCVRWTAYNRKLQQRAGDAPYDADGALAFGPFVTPRLTPIASRCEAGIATLVAARAAGWQREELDAIDGQMRRALALLLRQQFVPGPVHLFAEPEAVWGAMPGSESDWQLRIDYEQHAGSALVRWIEAGGEGRP
jgi:hypothetical protein